MMDQAATRAVEQFVHANYPLDAAAILLVEVGRHTRGGGRGDGGHPPRAGSKRRHRDPRVEGRGAAAALLVRPQGGVSRGRDASRPTTTASTARSRARRCRACCARSPRGRRSTGLPCANVFHAGDGNLHPLILFDANKPGETERTIEFGDRILELCIEVGGTVTGEHGVGVEKLRGDVRAVRARRSSSASTAIKEAFDAHRPAQSGQGGAHAAPLRGDGPHARAPWRAPASRPAALLKPRIRHERPRSPPANGPRLPSSPSWWHALAQDFGERANTTRRDPRAARPRRGARRPGAARRRRLSAHQRGSRGHRAPVPRRTRAGDRVRRRHVARRPRRRALRRRVHRPLADEPRARDQRRRPRLPRAGRA